MTSPKDTKGQDQATLDFLQSTFSRYYERAPLAMPDRFGRREWGFMFFGRGSMLRHVALKSKDEVRSMLRNEAPAHSYHSTAYYEKPAAPTMKEKGWLGADLIFDLDADHIEGSERMSYEEMLAVVKREIIRLAEEFLLGDLGFDSDHIHLVFSGGRGYHIHVTDPRVLELTSHERREIVDYITGVGLDLEMETVSPATAKEGNPHRGIFRLEVVGSTGRGRFARPLKMRRLPPNDAPGWEGRMARATMGMLDELEAMGEKLAVDRMSQLLKGPGRKGLGTSNAHKLYSDLFDTPPSGESGADKMRKTGVVDVFSREELARWFVEMIKETAGVKLERKASAKDEEGEKPAAARVTEVKATGETDEPVTSDIKRLIRLPTSLHGKTGFCVVPLTLDAVKDFDPLKDAVVLPSDPVKVNVVRAIEMKLKGEHFKLVPGLADLPRYAAIFAMGRGAAIVATR